MKKLMIWIYALFMALGSLFKMLYTAWILSYKTNVSVFEIFRALLEKDSKDMQKTTEELRQKNKLLLQQIDRLQLLNKSIKSITLN